jgi:hypothetical protein
MDRRVKPGGDEVREVSSLAKLGRKKTRRENG